MAGNKALVTGGAGFIGSHIVDELLKKDFEVVVLDDLSGGFRENVNKDAIFVKGSINDEKLVNKLFDKYKFDYVFHLAAYAAEGLSHFIRKFNYDNNLMGSINLINASVRNEVKCFVFTSSIAVYGANQLPMLEETEPRPEDPYGVSKYAVELDLKAAKHMFGLNYIVFRPHNVYGERQNIGDRYRNVLGIFMNRLMKNEPLPVFGDGEQQRAFTHIADVAPIIAESIFNQKAYNQVFNVGADVPYTVNKLISVVSKAMGIVPKVKYLPPRNEVKFAYSDHSKAQKILGYNATVTLEDGVKRMVEWAKKAGSRKSSKFENIEIDKHLPPSWREEFGTPFYFFGTRKPDFTNTYKVDDQEYWNKRGFDLKQSLTKQEQDIFSEISSGASVLYISKDNSRLPLSLMEQKKCNVTVAGFAQALLDGYASLGLDTMLLSSDKDQDIKLSKKFDYIILNRILEQIPYPEVLIEDLSKHTKYLVTIIPNSAFYRYRWHLLFHGRFFTQWVYHPSESLRYWSHSDFLDWLEGRGLILESSVPLDGLEIFGFALFKKSPNIFAHNIAYFSKP